MKRPHWSLGLCVAALLAAPLSASAQSVCTALDETTFVHDALQDIYFWYRELPDLNPALYETPEEYLEAVRYRPLDTTFSYITPRAASDAFYSSSQYIGIGFSSQQVGPRELRVSQVFPDSPASEAGLARGDDLIAIDGRSVGDLLESGELGLALGPNEIDYTLELTWRGPDGAERGAALTKRPVTIPTVSQTAVFDLGGLPVGYVHLRNFVEPSFAALDEAFAEMKARGVVDLVLDLRYNGGGLIDVARHLGGLIGGSGTSSQVFLKLAHNDKNTFRDRSYTFEDPEQSLSLRRLVVITTRASASSSELVINGLKPFIPVTIIGDRTYGKPVGQYGFDFCDKVLFPVSFENRNANDEGNFYDGLGPDCSASDGLDRPLGDPEEASLAEALHYLREGACSARAEEAARALRTELEVERAFGFQQLVNAW